MTRFRSALDSPAALFALISVFVALVSLWTIRLPKVPATSSFGFQALFLATLDSPIAPLFQTVNGMADLPDPLPTRAPTWILLGAAALFMVLSVLDTIRVRRRLPQP